MLIKKVKKNRQRSLFVSLLTDTLTLEWFNTIDETKVLNDIKDYFLDRFTDNCDKFRNRLELAKASKPELELIKTIFVESSALLIKFGQ